MDVAEPRPEGPEGPDPFFRVIIVMDAMKSSLDRYAEAHPGASSDLELVQSLWIQEVPKK